MALITPTVAKTVSGTANTPKSATPPEKPIAPRSCNTTPPQSAMIRAAPICTRKRGVDGNSCMSSSTPIKTNKDAPINRLGNWVNGSSSSSADREKPRNMARPPTRGTAPSWTLRPPGLSTKPIGKASWRSPKRISRVAPIVSR